MANEKTILITGATGKQGGATLRHLAKRGGFKLRAMTRKPDGDAAKALSALGAEVVAGDLNDAASLERAVAGAWGVFAVQNTWEAGVEGEEEQGKRFAKIARDKGVQHFVYTLGRLRQPGHGDSALREQAPRRGDDQAAEVPVARHPAAGVLHGEPAEPMVPQRRQADDHAEAGDEAADGRRRRYRQVQRRGVRRGRQVQGRRDRRTRATRSRWRRPPPR